jgi:hypothetical protein
MVLDRVQKGEEEGNIHFFAREETRQQDQLCVCLFVDLF